MAGCRPKAKRESALLALVQSRGICVADLAALAGILGIRPGTLYVARATGRIGREPIARFAKLIDVREEVARELLLGAPATRTTKEWRR